MHCWHGADDDAACVARVAGYAREAAAAVQLPGSEARPWSAVDCRQTDRQAGGRAGGQADGDRQAAMERSAVDLLRAAREDQQALTVGMALEMSDDLPDIQAPVAPVRTLLCLASHPATHLRRGDGRLCPALPVI